MTPSKITADDLCLLVTPSQYWAGHLFFFCFQNFSTRCNKRCREILADIDTQHDKVAANRLAANPRCQSPFSTKSQGKSDWSLNASIFYSKFHLNVAAEIKTDKTDNFCSNLLFFCGGDGLFCFLPKKDGTRSGTSSASRFVVFLLSEMVLYISLL